MSWSLWPIAVISYPQVLLRLIFLSDEKSHGKSLAHNVIKSSPPEKALMLPEVKENVQPAPLSRNEVSIACF